MIPHFGIETMRIQTQQTIFSNMDRRFILLHYTTKEDWWVSVDHISAIRCKHDKEDSNDNGVWVYLTGDEQPVTVNETPEEIFNLIKSI